MTKRVSACLCAVLLAATMSVEFAQADRALVQAAIAEAKFAVSIAKSERKDLSQRTVTSKAGPNFSGFWAGRYIKVSETCASRVSSIDFRHALNQAGGRARLATNHDGNFTGSSRSKGRRLDFGKSVTFSNGVTCGLGLVYRDMARNQRSATTALAAVCNNGCRVAFGGNALR